MMGTEHGYLWYISTNVRLGQNPHRAVHIANAVQRSKANTEQGLSAGTYAADKKDQPFKHATCGPQSIATRTAMPCCIDEQPKTLDSTSQQNTHIR